jgi:8-oxo-dGTP diphosphatase
MSKKNWKDKLDCPKLSVDCIIEYNKRIVLIERKYAPLGWALPGGFVDSGETVEDAVRREIKEEVNLTLDDLRQFHVYSEPSRDPRFHTVSVIFTAKSRIKPSAADDAKNCESFSRIEIMHMISLGQLVFDHGDILKDYFKYTE